MRKQHYVRAFLMGLSMLWSVSAIASDLIITSEIPTSTNPSPYIEQFIKNSGEATKGRIKGQYFPASQLYNDRDALAALGTGAVHMVWPVSSRLETLDPRTGIISLPFALTERDLTNACFSSGFTKQVSEYLGPKGLAVLGFVRTADLLFIMRDKDIKTVDDLKGLKVRVVGGKVMLDAMRTVGASPVSMSASEMSAALAQGAIDGALTSPAGWADVLGHTAKYAISVPGMSLATSAVVVDKAWFDSLSAADQSALRKVLQEIIQRQWKETVEKDKQLLKTMVDQGGHHRVLEPAEVDVIRAKFDSASASFVSKYKQVSDQTAALRRECGNDG